MIRRLKWAGVVGLVSLQVAAAGPAWLTDLPSAQAKAKSEKKLVLLDFSGSNWCPGCMLLERDVFRTPEFAAYAQKNLVLVRVDFPRPNGLPMEQRLANAKLAQQLKIEYFPTVVLEDSSGKELGRTEAYDGAGQKIFLERLEKRFKD